MCVNSMIQMKNQFCSKNALLQKISAFGFLLPLWVLLVAQNAHPRLRNCPPFALQIDHQNRQSTVSPSIPPLLVKNPIRVKAEQSKLTLLSVRFLKVCNILTAT